MIFLEYKKLLLILSLTALLTGCSSETLDNITPSANNSWDMRLTPEGLGNGYLNSSIEDDDANSDEDSEDTSNDDKNTISRGDINEVINTDSPMENEVISSTLTDDVLDSLNKIDANIENAPDVDIVNASQVHAAAYIDKYLNPKVTDILNVIKSNTNVRNYPTLYFKVMYRGLDKDESGTTKWVTYSKSYQNLKDSDYLISNQATILSQLANWGSVSKSLNSSYKASAKAAVDFGNCILKDGVDNIFVKDCSREQLLSLLSSKENSTIKNKYINYYLESVSSKNGISKYASYSTYLNSFKNSIDLSYSAASMTAAHLTDVMPSFSSSLCEWISYATKENSFDKNTTLTRRRIAIKDMSAVFATSKSKNTGMGKNHILYSSYDKYGGNAYYFENGNHKLAIFFYGDNLWKDENSEVENIIKTSLVDLKGPQDFSVADF